MARFETLTANGNYQEIHTSSIDEATSLGLGSDPKQLSGLYNALVGGMRRFYDEEHQPIDGARIVMPTRSGEAKLAPIVGADQALVATEILQGTRHPKTEPVGLTYQDSILVLNKAFKADPRRDRPYLHGFLNILRVTATNLGYEMAIGADDSSIEQIVSGDTEVALSNPTNNHMLYVTTAGRLSTDMSLKNSFIATSPDTMLFIPGIDRSGSRDITYGNQDPNQYRLDV